MQSLRPLTGASLRALARRQASSHQAAIITSQQLKWRSAAISTQSGSPKTIDLIIHDHSELSDYYQKIKNAQDEETKVRWQNQFTWELARHSIAEELVVYPAMEKHLGDKGKEMAEKDRKEHRSVGIPFACFAVR